MISIEEKSVENIFLAFIIDGVKLFQSCTEELDKIEHCMKLKNYIVQTNREIEFIEKQLDRQNQIIRFLLNRSKKDKPV